MSKVDHVTAVLRSMRRRMLACESVVGLAYAAAGVGFALLPARAAASWLGHFAWAIATYGGIGVCLVAVLGVARRILRPPSLSDVALHVELMESSFRDSVLTALEAGPLAEASAAYALRVNGAAGHLGDHRPRGRSRASLAAYVCAVLAVCVGISHLEANPRRVRSDAPVDVGSPRRPETVVADVVPLPSERRSSGGHLVEVVVGSPHRVTPPVVKGVTAASDVLLTAPSGLELAVEFFVVGGLERSAPDTSGAGD